MTRSFTLGLLARTLAAFVAVATLAVAAEEHDAAYWIDRMEASLLPKASLRARFVLDTASRPQQELRGQLARVQGPTQIRSIVAIERPDRERRVLLISSTPGGELESGLYLAGEPPLRIRVARTDPFLSTAFTYEDLGFVEQRKAADTRLEEEDLPTGRVIVLTSGPYGPYGRVETRLDPKTALPKKVEYYDRDEKLVRTVTYGGLEKHGIFSFPQRIEAVETKTGRRSTLRMLDVQLGAEVYEYELSDDGLRELAIKVNRQASPY